jgi:LPS sulfotransferase NodH
VATSYIICTTPRSGSTLLCTLLAATARAGRPDSFYHAPHIMQQWADAWGLSDARPGSSMEYDAAYLAATLCEGRGDTPVFGMRLQHAYLAPLMVTLARLYPGARSDTERFARAFGQLRYLYLTRTDKVAQAVSLVKARQSGLWHRNADGSERERTAPVSAPNYDPVAIGREVADFTQADRAWCQWFANERIEPLRLVYEAFAPEPALTVRKICRSIGIEPPAADIHAGVARLADGINSDWAARYRAERANYEN